MFLHPSGKVIQQVLHGIEVRRVRREVDAADAFVVEPVLDQAGFVFGIIVLQEPPLLWRVLIEVEVSGGEEMVLRMDFSSLASRGSLKM
jgi:hypothetical protein